MANSTFDTHELVKTLGAAGMPEKQAEAITAAIRKQYEVVDVVTKADFEGYKLETRHEFELLRREMATKEDLHQLKEDFGQLKGNFSRLEMSTKEDFSRLEMSTKEDFRSLEIRMVKWIAGFAAANMTLLIAIAAFLVTR